LSGWATERTSERDTHINEERHIDRYLYPSIHVYVPVRKRCQMEVPHGGIVGVGDGADQCSVVACVEQHAAVHCAGRRQVEIRAQRHRRHLAHVTPQRTQRLGNHTVLKRKETQTVRTQEIRRRNIQKQTARNQAARFRVNPLVQPQTPRARDPAAPAAVGELHSAEKKKKADSKKSGNQAARDPKADS